MTPSTYIHLCARATPESLRRHPVTSPYASTFFTVARRNGFNHARAWLLGQLLFDLHPEPHTAPTLPLQQDPQLPPTDGQPPDTPRARLQQHIEAAAAHVDTFPTFP